MNPFDLRSLINKCLVAALSVALVGSGHSQSTATLSDIGSGAPPPGSLDIYQPGTTGDTNFPDGLNYYTDNQTEHNAGEPGQTFTTPAGTNGFVLTQLALKSAGLSSGGGSPAGNIDYVLHVYSVSGGNVSLLASYTSASPLSYAEGDWLMWTGLSLALSPATTYAYSFGKAASGGGWDAIGVAGANPYPGGEIALIPPAGGALTLGASHAYDASFDIGLLNAGPPTAPLITNLAASGIQARGAILNGRMISTGGALPTVTVYYGKSDGGTNPVAWASHGVIGTETGAFSATLPGLSPATTYFYTTMAANAAGTAWASPSLSFTTLVSDPVAKPVAALAYRYDDSRIGLNTNESVLSPGRVNVNTFGRLFSYPVDGQVYAQPLVATNISIPGKGTHNVLYVVTEHDSAYAFDADSNQGTNGGLLWRTNLGVSAVTPNNDFGNRYGPYHDLNPEVGITGTPVIDPVSGTIYFDAFTHEGTNIYYHRIHALDLATGAERPYSPMLVAASVPGTGVEGANGVVTFVAELQLQRPALTLLGGKLYVCYGSYADTDPYHGWILGYNATNFQLTASYIFNTTPNATVNAFGNTAGEGAIWMAGNGPAVDSASNLYFETANGSFSQNTNGGDYGDTFMKLSTTNGFAVADYFTPYNQAALQTADQDLGSGGPMLLPDEAGSVSHPHLLVGAGKEGKIYLLDTANLGHYNSSSDSQIVQSLPGAIGGAFSSPAYFNHLIYYQGINDVLKAFSISNATINATPVSRAASACGFPSGTPVVTADGLSNAVVWLIQADGTGPGGAAILHAYNATNLASELYNSSQDFARDNPGVAVKFTVPTVAGGKVYVGAQDQVSVYGPGLFLSPPVITPNGGVFAGAATVVLSDFTPGTAIYYTVNGGAPDTNSTRYIGPFVVTNSATIRAMAAAPGAINSPVTGATITVLPLAVLTTTGFDPAGAFRLGATVQSGSNYILEATTNFVTWTPLATNVATNTLINLTDPGATNFPYRFYRIQQK